ncbi:Alpha N-terminal protein methyltransferase 1 [Auxenochlorella protothecoides]|uniref:Alpha N-terminal protein methyltransferase 1 n=1 Tax=Auxenochlorella protothecoides TaxID=3075 RepID=A0A087SHE5_AUXPR|nr:Alpha N-terminal protein methyltransferase 1 [Auxenochlorella protothecoides]KFM25149.1 Alpha N-terminal protein methyltransferase 1 [Auxenochlorella protothecoides]
MAFLQEPSLTALLAGQMREWAVETEAQQGALPPLSPLPEPVRDPGAAPAPLGPGGPRSASPESAPRSSSSGGRRLRTLQDTAEAIGLIPAASISPRSTSVTQPPAGPAVAVSMQGHAAHPLAAAEPGSLAQALAPAASPVVGHAAYLPAAGYSASSHLPAAGHLAPAYLSASEQSASGHLPAAGYSASGHLPATGRAPSALPPEGAPSPLLRTATGSMMVGGVPPHALSLTLADREGAVRRSRASPDQAGTSSSMDVDDPAPLSSPGLSSGVAVKQEAALLSFTQDWSYEASCRSLAQELGWSTASLDRWMGEVLGPQGDGRKRGRPRQARDVHLADGMVEPTTSEVLVRLMQDPANRLLPAEELRRRTRREKNKISAAVSRYKKSRRDQDLQDKEYASPQEFWDEVAAARSSGAGPQWYDQAVRYWDTQEASDDGVLGGFGELSDPDIVDSRKFLAKVDCGAGIGRVTQALLLHTYQEVDLVEPSAHLLERARTAFEGRAGKDGIPPGHCVVNYFQQGLEAFHPEPQRYNALWLQWAVLYLTDEDAIAFFQRCAKALKPGGFVFVKENVCPDGFVVDRSDCSITRNHKYYLELFSKGGLTLAHSATQ